MLVGFAGKGRAGKSTAAECLVREYGFTTVALADPIKRALREIFNFDEDALWGDGNRTAPDKRFPLVNGGFLTTRHCMQSLGTFWGRDACYPDVWVDYLLRIVAKIETGDWHYDRTRGLGQRLQGALLPLIPEILAEKSEMSRTNGFSTDVVVPDVRFKNEIDKIHNHGGFVFRINRPGAGLEGEAGKHRSETEIDECPDSMFDAIIENVGTMAEFCRNVCNQFVIVKGRN